MPKNRTRRAGILGRAAAGLIVAAGFVLLAAPAQPAAAAAITFASQPTHEILLSTGQTVKVEILKESDSEVEVNLFVGSMSAPRTYQRSEIVSITEIGQSTAGAAAPTKSTKTTRASKSGENIPDNALRVYVMELGGRFGWDVSYTPVNDALEKAREMNADVIIVKCNADWKQLEGFVEEKGDDQGEFEEYSIAEAIHPAFTSEMRAKWEKQPQVVFWVERAMSGMAFLPLVKNDIYFTSDGRMGGVGGLDELFGNMGDEVVRDKQKSLREAYVKGMAIEGGHDPKIVEAMIKKSYVLSYRIENGKPVYLVGEEPGWILLTDDGQDERADTNSDLVRGLGNDSLTLTSDLAYKLQISKGTADSLDDLLFQMGIEDRAYVLDDKDEDGETDAARRELDSWSTGIERAAQKLRRLQFDLGNVQERQMRNDPDGSKARNAARAQRTRIINEAIALLNKYGEVLDPGNQFRNQLELQRQQIENEKRLERTRGGGGG